MKIDPNEVLKQIELNHEQFCLGVHIWTDSDGYECQELEWTDWKVVAKNLADQLISNSKQIEE